MPNNLSFPCETWIRIKNSFGVNCCACSYPNVFSKTKQLTNNVDCCSLERFSVSEIVSIIHSFEYLFLKVIAQKLLLQVVEADVETENSKCCYRADWQAKAIVVHFVAVEISVFPKNTGTALVCVTHWLNVHENIIKPIPYSLMNVVHTLKQYQNTIWEEKVNLMLNWAKGKKTKSITWCEVMLNVPFCTVLLSNWGLRNKPK